MTPKEEGKILDEVERLRVQLVGCSVAALYCATGDNDPEHGAYGWSVAFEDVKTLRSKHDELRNSITQLFALTTLTDRGFTFYHRSEFVSTVERLRLAASIEAVPNWTTKQEEERQHDRPKFR